MLLNVLSSEPIVLSSEEKYHIGDDPELDNLQFELDDLRKEVTSLLGDEDQDSGDTTASHNEHNGDGSVEQELY